jgi:Glycosyl transferase family 2
MGAQADLAAMQGSAPGGEAILVSGMRNEAPFLLEWVAYHRVIGFSRIVVCANPSTDGTDALLAALAGVGAIIYLPTDPAPDQSPLEAAAAAFEAAVGYQDGNWYAWLDADEFLNIHVGDHSVPALVAALGPAHGIMLNWRLFGTNDHDVFPGRFISPDFSRASKPDFVGNLETKSFFRRSAAVSGFAGIGQERPRLAPGQTLGAGDFLGGNGKPLLADEPRNVAWLQGQPLGRTNLSSRKERGAALAQINHYAVRTPEFFHLKRLRGRGFLKSAQTTGHARYTDKFFDRFDRNEVEERSILVWQDRVTAEIERLLQAPAVAEAHQQAMALVAADLAAVTYDAPKFDLAERAKPAFQLTFGAREATLVRKLYAASSAILEYGSGGSTVLAASLGKPVVTVESDKDWADRMVATLAAVSPHAHVHHVDIGPTKAWGFPASANAAGLFHHYALSVWDRPDLAAPDLVLIDGRFRAACLAATVMRSTRPVTVLFDDYTKRGYYHRVERLAKLEGTVGRMARFTVTPGPIPPDMLTEVIGWFTDPR